MLPRKKNNVKNHISKFGWHGHEKNIKGDVVIFPFYLP